MSTTNGHSHPPELTSAQLEERLRCRLLQTQLAVAESFTLDIGGRWVDPREPFYDDPSFLSPSGMLVPTGLDHRGKGEVIPLYLSASQLKLIRDDSRHLCAHNEYAICATEARVSYVFGTGLSFGVVPRDGTPAEQDPVCQAAQDYLDEWCARARFGEVQQDCLRRCDRDGEAFLRLFDQGERLDVRWVQPEHVVEPDTTPEHSFGIKTPRDDIEDVEGYWVREDPDANSQPVLVDASEVVHIKLNTDMDAKRGLPTYYPVRKNLARIEKLQTAITVMATVQANFAVIRRHTASSASAVQAFQQSLADFSMTQPGLPGTRHMKQMMPGSIIDAPATTEYEFPAGSPGAGLVEIVGSELRAVASRLVMPEYMLSADASNANYASTLVAEAPAVKNFERLRAYFASRLGDGCYYHGYEAKLPLLWRVLVHAVRAGLLSPETLERCEIKATGPELVSRDRAADTQRFQTLNQFRVMSRETWARKEDLDPDQEQRLLESEYQDDVRRQQDQMELQAAYQDGPGGESAPGGGGGDSAPSPDDYAERPEGVREDIQEVEEGQSHWVRFVGPRGGKGWKNTSSGLIHYGDEPPGEGHAHNAIEPRPGRKKAAPGQGKARRAATPPEKSPGRKNPAGQDRPKKRPAEKADKGGKSKPEWDGTIDADRVDEDRGRGDHLAGWDYWDGDEGPFENAVYLQHGEYDPDPDDPDSEIVDVWRWVSRSTDSGVTDRGDWTADEREATRDGKRFARDSHQEPPDEEDPDEDEDDEDEDEDEDDEPEQEEDKDGIDLDDLPGPKKRDVKLGSEALKRSNADITISRAVDEDKADDVVHAIFGGERGDYTALMESIGMPDDAKVRVVHAGPWEALFSDDLPVEAVGVRVEVDHPKMGRVSRFVGVDSEGKRFIRNEVIEIKPEYQGEGMGADIFSRQVEAASAEGIDYIQTHAAGKKGGKMNGYYTWPRFGYDMSLTDPDGITPANRPIYEEARRRFPGAETVLDVMSTREGRDWWKENGRDLYNARFDLTPGSRSMQVLSAYVAERQSKKGGS